MLCRMKVLRQPQHLTNKDSCSVVCLCSLEAYGYIVRIIQSMSLYDRALLQKRPIIWRSLLIEATPHIARKIQSMPLYETKIHVQLFVFVCSLEPCFSHLAPHDCSAPSSRPTWLQWLHFAVCCSVLQCVAVWLHDCMTHLAPHDCSAVMQSLGVTALPTWLPTWLMWLHSPHDCTATHCDTLQHTATHCNTLPTWIPTWLHCPHDMSAVMWGTACGHLPLPFPCQRRECVSLFVSFHICILLFPE